MIHAGDELILQGVELLRPPCRKLGYSTPGIQIVQGEDLTSHDEHRNDQEDQLQRWKNGLFFPRPWSL